MQLQYNALCAFVLLFPWSRWAQMAQHQLTVRHHADHKHNLHGLPTVVPLVTEGAAKLPVSDATTSCFLSQHRLHCTWAKKQAIEIIALQCVINEKKKKKKVERVMMKLRYVMLPARIFLNAFILRILWLRKPFWDTFHFFLYFFFFFC